MGNQPFYQQPNTLGKASLALGISSLVLVFSIGLFATPLFICGAISAFLGFVGAILGFAGLFGANRSRATAIVGLVLGAGGACLFIAILLALSGGG